MYIHCQKITHNKAPLALTSKAEIKRNQEKRIRSRSTCTLHTVSTFPKQTASLSQCPFSKLWTAFDISAHRKRTPRLNISTRGRAGVEASANKGKRRTRLSSFHFPIGSRTLAKASRARPVNNSNRHGAYLDLTWYITCCVRNERVGNLFKRIMHEHLATTHHSLRSSSEQAIAFSSWTNFYPQGVYTGWFTRYYRLVFTATIIIESKNLLDRIEFSGRIHSDVANFLCKWTSRVHVKIVIVIY